MFLRNHVFLVLQHLGLLAASVATEIAGVQEEDTNSSAFRQKFGAMPDRAALLKNVRQLIPRYGIDVGLTPAGGEIFGNMHQVLRVICVPENLTIWSCQYMVLLNNMVFSDSGKWAHKRECESIRKRPASSSSMLESRSVKNRGAGRQ